jgi:VWFA-related protein
MKELEDSMGLGSMSIKRNYVPCLAVLLASAFAVGLAAEQSATPSNANQVNLIVTVRDKHGKVISDLSQSDFVLEQDGHPQTIRSFAKQTDLPLTLGLVVDTGANQSATLDQERSASGSLMDQLIREDRDKAFLIHFDREVELLQDLTGSREKMNAALRLLQTPQPQFKNAGNDQGSGSDDNTGGGSDGNSRVGRTGQGRMNRGGKALLYDSIYLASSDVMQKQHGRKAIIVLSDGVDRGSKTSLEGAIEAAQRNDTAVYSILIAGKEKENQNQGLGRGGMGGPLGRRGGGYPGGYPGGGYPGGGYPGGGYPGGGSPGGRRCPQQEERPDGKKILERISNETGGRMFEVGKKQSLDQIYQEIQDGLHNQYSLGYTPDSTGSTAELHQIHLTTKKKDLVVEAKKAYYEAPQSVEKSESSPDVTHGAGEEKGTAKQD